MYKTNSTILKWSDWQTQHTFYLGYYKKNYTKLLQITINMYKTNSAILQGSDNRTDWQNIDQGVWQGCPLSPSLFNIYMNDMIIHWNETLDTETYDDTIVNMQMFADDQVLLSD
jgi:hypothetical protein